MTRTAVSRISSASAAVRVRYAAVIFDMDSVVTDTASLYAAAAWRATLMPHLVVVAVFAVANIALLLPPMSTRMGAPPGLRTH